MSQLRARNRWGRKVLLGRRRAVGARRDRRSELTVDGLETRCLLSTGGSTAVQPMQVFNLPGGDAERVSTDLLINYDRAKGVAVTSSLQDMDTGGDSPLMTDSEGRVEVNVTAGNATTLAPILAAAGMNVVSVLPQYDQVEGYIPWSALPAISNLGSQGLMGIIGVEKPITSVGSVTAESVNVIEADRVQASTPGYNGSGVTVGVLSDSFDNVAEPVVTIGGTTYTGAAADEQTGDLPPTVDVLQDISGGGTDEGRAMLQIVHKTAPGASEDFATADISEGQFAANIQNLANAGAKVINDDITYFDEPLFQPGIVAQAVTNVVTNDSVSYFAAAGNIDDQAYDTASPLAYGTSKLDFVTDTISGISSSPGQYLNFSPNSSSATDKMTITLSGDQEIDLAMEYDQPYYSTNGVTTNVSIYLLNHSTGAVVAASTDNNITDQIPFQFLDYQNASSSSTQYDIVIQNAQGPNPGEIKFVNYGANDNGDVDFGTFATNSATINPHAAVPAAMAVGAVPFFDQRTTESYSAFGPSVTFLFDANGNRLATPLTVDKPNVLAPDGDSTTFFGGDFINGFPNFFGTSAATPSAAAEAALILQANPSDTPSQVYSAEESTADPVITGNAAQIGSGLIDAYRAIFGGPTPVSPDTADSFATGALENQWQVYTSDAGRVQVTSDFGPPPGSTYQLVMDSNLNPPAGEFYALPNLDEATLNVNLAGRQDVTLSFDQQFFNSLGFSVTAMPATFTGHSLSTGVAFSVDGTNWFRITSLGSSVSTPYATDTFDLSTIAAADGVTLGADTLIKFQEYNADSVAAPELGLAIGNVNVDAAPTVTAVSSTTPNGTYGAGSVIAITVAFNNPVVVTGTPELALNSGGTASYSSGSGTNTLTFDYTVATGQSANPLDEASSGALTLNGGMINDANSGVPALLTLPAPGTTGALGVNKTIVISTTTASTTVTGVSSSTAAGDYGVGSTISIQVAFSGIVNVTGTPQLALNTGGTASYTSGSGSSTLTFSYTVAAGQSANPLDDASSSALTLNGGTIDDQSSNPANLSLPAPGSANSLSQSNIVIDTTAPAVTGVTSTSANGTYGVSSVITITMAWSKPVVVTGTPQLALNSGGTANYSSGTGTSTLTFTYTVAAGQNSPKLDYTSSTALTLNGGTIFDTVTNPNAANLTLAAPGSSGSIGGTKSIVIDTTAPTVTGVTSTTANGTYGVSSVITITVGWSKNVVVTGTPQLALNSGGTASYSSGSGTSTLTFTYTVAAGQNSTKLDYTSTTALTLNGGTIFDTVTNPNAANLTLATPGSAASIGGTKSIAIDTTAPTVTGVTSTTANGTYGVSSVITITVGWSKNVVVTGTPELALNSGGTASYSSGSGTSTLTFTYTVAAGQNSSKLDYTSTGALTLNGGTIFDTVTNPNAANLTLAAPGSAGSIGGTKSIVIDTTSPTVTGVTSTTANGTYGVGSVITITVGWSKPVVVTGTPELALNSGGTASYSSGSGTSTLTFTYTVAAGQNSTKLDYTSTGALTLNGGTIFDTVTNPNAANLTLAAPGSSGSIGGTKSIAIDTTAPTVTGVTSTTANGTYGVSSVITITVGWSKNVVVTGTPELALNSGGTASYSSGSGTSTLTFTYTVAAGQNSSKLDYTSTSALTLNGGTIFDTVTNPNAANLTLAAPGSSGSLGGTKSIAIDTTSPTVTGVTSTTANGTYGVSSVITITVGWSTAVVVTGTPELALNSGGTATYASGSGTSTLTFTYTVAAGQNSSKLDYTSTTALTLNGGTIFDTVTNPNAANLTLAAPGSSGSIGGTKSIAIDTTAPTVTGVTSTTANGTYGVNSVITITVGWSENVAVTGTPKLTLNSGGTASYSSGSGTSTLTFTYTVAAGQNSAKLDYTSTSALTLNGGTIFDTVTNPNAANLTLAAPGSAGSIGGTTSIAIDTTAPTVTGVSSTTPNGTYGIGATITITVGWSKNVVVTGTPELALNSGGTASYSSGSGTSTLTFTYTVAAGQNSSKLDYTSTSALTLNGGTIFDTVTNPNAANLTLAAPGSAGSIGGTKSIVIDTSVTSIIALSSTTASGSYGIGSSIVVTVSFSGAVVVTGTPQLALNSGGTASYTTGSGTSTLSFTYIVAAGDDANPLDELSTTALTLNGGTIDNANNGSPALLTLPAPGSANSLSQSNIVIDTTAPTVTGVTSTTANGTYGVSSVITITVGWSKNVVVTGTPELALNSGGTASYSSGSGTSTLTFTYTVAAGQNSSKLDYTSTTALTLNGGTIFDTVINPNAANLTLASPGSSGSIGGTTSIAIDTTAPTVTGVSSTTPNGTYGIGAVITITVGWSKNVVVTGTPELALNSGGTASYSSGSGTSTLTFTYTVAAGQNSSKLDYTSTSALTLNGGTIFDTVTNPNAANLTLAAPGSSGSIGGTKSIVIDTSVTSIMTAPARPPPAAATVLAPRSSSLSVSVERSS